MKIRKMALVLSSALAASILLATEPVPQSEAKAKNPLAGYAGGITFSIGEKEVSEAAAWVKQMKNVAEYMNFYEVEESFWPGEACVMKEGKCTVQEGYSATCLVVDNKCMFKRADKGLYHCDASVYSKYRDLVDYVYWQNFRKQPIDQAKIAEINKRKDLYIIFTETRDTKEFGKTVKVALKQGTKIIPPDRLAGNDQAPKEDSVENAFELIGPERYVAYHLVLGAYFPEAQIDPKQKALLVISNEKEAGDHILELDFSRMK